MAVCILICKLTTVLASTSLHCIVQHTIVQLSTFFDFNNVYVQAIRHCKPQNTPLPASVGLFGYECRFRDSPS